MTDVLTTTTSLTHSWHPPGGVTTRGTLLVLPGRGEHGGVYERFGRRLAADGYAVHTTGPGVEDAPDSIGAALLEAAGADPVTPLVLVGADTGALLALRAAGDPRLPVDGIVLAGIASAEAAAPGRTAGTAVSGIVSSADSAGYRPGDGPGWQDELGARTACPVHRRRLSSDPEFRRGALSAPVPAALLEPTALTARGLPVLVLHGDADPVTSADEARGRAEGFPRAVVGIVHGGVHDVLNDASHRTVAATVVQWLERLRGGAELSPVLTVETDPHHVLGRIPE
ncbi:alpha/beta hydrolase [Streptomyces sp. NPDC006733]|uniref:alpha/beta hydrolase n=1 Tax=Streptomyces sp. NPDC006733 TaxID=3155460 RepID=UPI003408207A